MRVEENKLAKIVFEAYLASNDNSEYGCKIRELSKLYNADTRYLRALRTEYLKIASYEEMEEYNKKTGTMNKNNFDYVSFCDDLFDNYNSFESQCIYLVDTNITLTNLNKYFSKYKKNGGKHADLVDDFYCKYKIFFENYSLIKKQEEMLKEYEYCLNVFDDIISVGAYSISDYVLKYYGSKEDNREYYDELVHLKDRIKDYDKKFEKNNWELIKHKMEINRKKVFVDMKENIDLFFSKLMTNSVDVIDYYLIIGMPFKKFKEICAHNISNSQSGKFNSFVAYYSSILEANNLSLKDSILKTRHSYEDVCVDDNEKHMIIDFMESKNIPLVFFGVALNKYKNGELDLGNVKKL